MTTLLPPMLFAVDAIVVLATAWLGVCWLAEAKWSPLERVLAWGLSGLMLVVGSGVLLGATGGLGWQGFLLVHAATGILAVMLRRSRRGEDVAALRALGLRPQGALRLPGAEGWLLGLLLVVGLSFFIFAFRAQPVVFDALTYRLSRVGQWLQDGRISVITTDDARLNYMPVAPDLVMAWLLGTGTEGFGAAAVAQTLGGFLALGATVGLARLTGLGRAASLAAALLLVGLPNVAPQFTSAYTDLFTAGVLAAAFYLWLAALLRGEGSVLGGAGAGLVLASKGTVAYFAPGLLPVVGWLAWRHRAGWLGWRSTLLGGVLAVGVFVLPWMLRNQEAYGGWVGPADFVTWHHGQTPGWRGSVEKLKLNLSSALAQLGEPNSQPPWWRAPVRAMGEAMVRRQPEHDPYAFDGLNRRANLEKIYAVAAPDADVTSTGVLLPLLGMIAALAAVFWRRAPGRDLALGWAVALAGFVLFMNWRLQWHPYQFRFLVLAAPWLAVLVVWWVGQLSRHLRAILWLVLAAVTTYGFSAAMMDTYQSGWPAVVRPEQSLGAYVYRQWRGWSAQLDHPAEALRPALPMNLPLAAFYRQLPARPVAPASLARLEAASAEAAVRPGDGWLIVPAARFIGHEGRVMARTWLYDGDEQNAFSLAAYRALREGDRPGPVVYRNRLVESADMVRRELLVRSWGPEPVKLELSNSGLTASHFTLRTPAGVLENEVGPGGRLWLEVPLPGDRAVLVTVEFPRTKAGRAAVLDARLLP